MIQKFNSDVQQTKLTKLYDKGNYLINSCSSDDSSQSPLQVIHEAVDHALKGPCQKAQFRNRWHNDDETHERAINDEILIFSRRKHLSDIREPDHGLRCLLTKSLASLTEALSSFESLRSVNLSSSLIGDEGIKILSDARNTCLDSLEELNLAENRFGSKGARILAMNTSWMSLKMLNLSDNSLEVEGIQYISENSSWTALQILLLKHVGLNIISAKALSANESWKGLQELYLDENLEFDDNGFMLLAHNNTWTKLQKLSISGCAIKYTELSCLRRNKHGKNFKIMTVDADKSKIIADRKFVDNKSMDTNSFQPSYLIRGIKTRGGEKTDDSASASEMLSKIYNYKARVESNKLLERELNLYIETRARDNLQEEVDEKNIESFSLEFKIKKFFLETGNPAKVLLLTGETGTGKSLFCKYLQRSILMDWNPDDQQESEDLQWLPVYIDLSKMKEGKTSAVMETLTRELRLSENEIKLLQDPNSDKLVPPLLFIFDGYDAFQDTSTLKGHHHYIRSNFYLLNSLGKDWPNAKIMITCREESLTEISQRELLFAPINEKRGASIPGTYLEYSIQPFSDLEITAYLRRYVIEQFPTQTQDDDINGPQNPSIKTQEQTSWSLAKNYEEIMDSRKSRDLLRIPLLLSISVGVLHDISERGYEEVSYLKEVQIPKDGKEPYFDRWFFYEAYINRTIESIAVKNPTKKDQTEKEEKAFQLELQQRLRFHALSMGNYTTDPKETQKKKELAAFDELLVSSSLLSKDSESSFRFIHRSLQEFLIAQSIANEIMELPGTNFSTQLLSSLLNQRPLEPKSQVTIFLAASCSSARLKGKVLLKLVTSSKENKPTKSKQKDADEDKEEKPTKGKSRDSKTKSEASNASETQPRFAPANAMTVLTISKFDFKKQDLSGVNIPGAYLSYGRFEKADFSDANLVGVDFTGAWLKEVNFSRADLSEADFGILPDLELGKPITCCEFSPDGQKLAVALGRDVIIFEKDADKLFFKEVRRVRGHETEVFSLAFSTDCKKLLSTGRDKMVNVWDTLTGACLSQLEGRKSTWKYSTFSPDGSKIAVSSSNQMIGIFDAETYEYNLEIKGTNKESLSCEFSPDGRQILFVDHTFGWTLSVRDAETGRFMRKYMFLNNSEVPYMYKSRIMENCYFLAGGRQVMAKSANHLRFYADTVRGHQFKTFQSIEKGVSYDSESKQTVFLRNDQIILQDAATGKFHPILQRSERLRKGKIGENFYFHAKKSTNNEYSVSYDMKCIAELLDENKRISFLDIPSVLQWRNNCGNADKLELRGAIIDSVKGLCKEHVPLFINYGEYKEIGKEIVEKYIIDSDSHEIVKEIILPKHNLSQRSAVIFGRNMTWVNLKKLDLSENSIKSEGAAAIAANTSWTALEELLLSSTFIDEKGGTAIGLNKTWKKLKILDLSKNSLKGEGVATIAKNTVWTELETLNLTDTSIEDKGLLELCTNNTWTKLKKLNVSITSTGALELAKNTVWKNLESLDLGSNSIDDQGVIELGKNTSWANLKTLVLGQNPFTPKGIEELAKNATWKNLISLNFVGVALKEEGMKVLSLNTRWKDLETLDLSGTLLGDEGAEALAQNSAWDNLKTLNLRDCQLKFAEKNCLEGSKWPKLETLDLSVNTIDTVGMAYLCKNKQWTNLKTLKLSIDASAAAVLAKESPWVNLEELNFEDGTIKEDGARKLSENTSWTKLRVLNLTKNYVYDAGAVHLGKNKSWVNLETLVLVRNEISAQGVEGLAKNTSWKNLQTLVLTSSPIGHVGAKNLAKNKSWTKLKKLQIENCLIGDKGAVELSKNTSWVNLEEINAEFNSITEEGEEALRNNNSWPKLTKLALNNTFT